MIVHLIGFPGAGKFTIARAMKRLWGAEGGQLTVVDNHLTSNTILSVVDADGVRQLPPNVWSRVGEVREIVMRAIEELSPPEWSFVFTNVLVTGSPEDEATARRVAGLARARGQVYAPVHVRCGTDELLRRVVGAGRRERMKWIDPDGVRAFVEANELLRPADGRTVTVDVTALSAEEAAAAIRRQLLAEPA